jgi:cytochrome c biogenesis protein CcdA
MVSIAGIDGLNLFRITGLALADSVNPCALAVLAMVLMTILIQNPEKRRRVLLTGFAFCLSVYVGYLFYGAVIIQFFKTFAGLSRGNLFYIYNGLAVFAMVLGALNIKDFFIYRKGGFGTEMPIWMRSKVKRVIDRITSPAGAFIIGFLVTIFLLPCTIGPYVIASGLLSGLGILKALPWLLYYNLIFILPMIAITLLIYLGFSRVEEVTGWRNRNVRILHLTAGILLLGVGVFLLMGWI